MQGWRSTLILGAVPALLGLGSAVRADPPRYTLEFLGPTLIVTDLNDEGWAIGQTISGSVVSWVWTPQGGQQFLPPLSGATNTTAHDINDAGVIVGTSGGQAVVWDHEGGVYGPPTVLPFLPGYSGGVATAINDAGDIVGLSTAGFQRPTLFTGPGAPIDLVPLGFWPTPTGLNNARQVCGSDLVLDLDTGVVTDLGVPGGPPSFLWVTATDINEHGQVCAQGTIATGQPDNRLPVRYTPGPSWINLVSLPTPYASTTTINDLGDTGIAYFKAVYLDGEGTFSPPDLIAPSVSGWSFGNVFAIENSIVVNDRRQLCTTAWNNSLGLAGAVLLTPTNLVGDVNGDGVTNTVDLLAVLAAWGSADAAADCNVDGLVGINDLLIVLAHWD